MSKRIFMLLLLTMCLTACGGQKAGATSGKSSTKSTTATTTQKNDFSIEPEEVPVVEDEFEEPVGITEEFSEEATEEASEVSGPIGTPDHPMAVDPTPYWEGEDYFDIESYLYACGVDGIQFRIIPDADITQNRVLFWMGDIDVWVQHDIIIVEKNERDNQDKMKLVTDLHQSNDKNIAVSKTQSVVIGSKCLDYLLAAMPRMVDNINEDGCPLAGIGFGPKHADVYPGVPQKHDD